MLSGLLQQPHYQQHRPQQTKSEVMDNQQYSSASIERNFVLRMFQPGSGKMRWVPVHELRLQLVAAPPQYTVEGVKYALAQKVIEDEDGTFWAAYTPANQ